MSSTIFTGNSRYSQDFQAVIDRAVAIASLPLVQMQSERSTLDKQSTALSSLDARFNGVMDALKAVESATGMSSFSSAVGDTTAVRASLSEGVLAGSYSVEVVSLGAYTNTMSHLLSEGSPAAPVVVADPAKQNVSATTTYKLSVGGVEKYTIDLTGKNTLNDLVAEINRQAGADVQATVVDLRTGGQPDYRISIQMTRLSNETVQLSAGAVPVLDQLVLGSSAQYKVNGAATVSSSTSRTVTISPGLTLELLKASEAGKPVSVNVTRNANGVSSAMQSFVNAFNGAVDELNSHRGEKPGALAGQSLISSLSDVLRSATSFSSGSSGINALEALGVTFTQEGKLSFSSATFNSAVDGKFNQLLEFLGTTTGSGFLGMATKQLNAAEDATNGLIDVEIKTLDAFKKAQDKRLQAEQERIDLLSESMQQRLAAADALIAQLEQQVNYLSGMFESMRIASQSMG